MNALVMSLAACASTAVGGLAGLAWRGRLRSVSAFSVGTLLGVVALHLLPDSVELARARGCGPWVTGLAVLLGLASLHAIDRWAHHRDDLRAPCPSPKPEAAGLAPAAAVVGHSLIDGAAIGLSFQSSTTLGASMALAVAAHDLCDGLNTVSLILAQRRGSGAALGMLTINALAPALGAAAATLLMLPAPALALAMAYVAGCLVHVLYSNLLPRVFKGGIAAAPWTAPALACCGFALTAVVPHGGA